MTSYSFSGEIQHTPGKRCFDFIVALLLLIMLAPLFLMIALLVVWTGPVFYADIRMGRGGQAFHCYKFRSMHVDAQERLQAMLKDNPYYALEWQACRKLRQDPRITRVGAFLRKTSLDELPQLWNVLWGEMSLVGPRPVTADELTSLYQEKAAKILRVRPGMTGLWQVSGRSSVSYQTRIALDEQYVDKRNWLLDGKILISTIPAVLFVRGAC